ncbi:hypothetical protein H2248_007483 [Termitomyces sp. 'cryptogamus']|nr:hypothetical protein H2248_007483 [Termitomyces sp. 'cryptogamus']
MPKVDTSSMASRTLSIPVNFPMISTLNTQTPGNQAQRPTTGLSPRRTCVDVDGPGSTSTLPFLTIALSLPS